MASSPFKFKVGDLVCLAHDKYRLYGYGIILEKSTLGDYKVFWIKDKIADHETAFDIVHAHLQKPK